MAADSSGVLLVGRHTPSDAFACGGPVVLVPWRDGSASVVCACVLCGARSDSGKPFMFELSPEFQERVERVRKGKSPT